MNKMRVTTTTVVCRSCGAIARDEHRRIRLRLRASAAILAFMATAAMAHADPYAQEPDGTVSIEAEHADVSVAVNGVVWGLIAPGGASGGQAMEASISDQPRLEYLVNFSQTGTYYVWIRSWGATAQSDSAIFGFDGNWLANTVVMSPINSWQWEGPYTINVGGAGVHTLGITRRESLAQVDKIFVGTSPSATPTGTGPAESGRGGGGSSNSAPVVNITAPTDGTSFDESATVNFTATATDGEDGVLTPSIAWSSSRDGSLGTFGGALSTAALSVGTHIITAKVTDSGLATGSAFITVTITAANSGSGVGAWLSPDGNSWPLIPLHAVLTPDGRVLTYGTKGDGTQTGFFVYDVWDPEYGLADGHITLDNRTQTDIFCSAQVLLPDSGAVFLAGGDNWTGTSTTNQGNNNTNLFAYSDDTLSRGNNMYRARWYATATTLVNGETYIQGGINGEDLPEVRNSSGNFRLLSGVPTSTLKYWYPRNFVAADGRVFGYDTNGKMYYVATGGTGSIETASTFPSSYAGITSSAVMFRPGKILQFGGNSNTAHVIDITAIAPKVTATASMSSQRQWVTATVLPDGRVLATGGSAVANQLTGVNNSAELWNPATGTWTVGASGSKPRLYHSTALLLPDASVLVGGGGAPGPVTNLNAEIYYPPYLYALGGGWATRPAINAAPDTLDLGEGFSVGVSSGTISRVTLVKTGAVTHSFNMDQRFLELSFTAASGTLFVNAPNSAGDAPPGYYLLFVLDANGVPSVGKIVKIRVRQDSTAPTQPTGLSLAINSSNGKPKLTWSQSTDNIRVAGYVVHRSTNGTLGADLKRVLKSPWTDTSAAAGRKYTYALEAYDVAGNLSVASAIKSINVP